MLASTLTDWRVEGRLWGPSAPRGVKSLHWFDKPAATDSVLQNRVQFFEKPDFILVDLLMIKNKKHKQVAGLGSYKFRNALASN